MEKEKIPEVENIKEKEEVVYLEKDKEWGLTVKNTFELSVKFLALNREDLVKTEDEVKRRKIQEKIDELEMEIEGYRELLEGK